jgi:hypothetical protein
MVLAACATVKSRMEVPQEVLDTSSADQRLREDLLTRTGGVGFVDYVIYPNAKQRKLTRIEVVTPYDNVKMGEERWFITDESGKSRSYFVSFIPDGRGGTTFTVKHEAPKSEK